MTRPVSAAALPVEPEPGAAIFPEIPAEEPPPGFEQTIPPPPGAFELPAEAGAAPVETPAAAEPNRPRAAKTERKKKAARGKGNRRDMRWLLVPALGLFAFLIVAAIGVSLGYVAGIQDRRHAESTQVVQAVDQQYQLALQDMNEGAYDRARQRFEYIINLNPGYPGAAEKLSEVLMYLNATATPTLQPTPTLTPTPDTRANDDLFNQAQQAVLNSQWDQAIEALLSLRKKDENYRPVEIDGMLYLALRNRGREKIVQTDLEGGIYDLGLATKFGPLDSEAKGLLNWSELYITGASFWDIDWAKVVEYFSQIAPNMPNLMDSSKMTATERLRLGLYNYGNTLMQQGKACNALSMYEQSLSMAPAADVQTAYEQAAGACGGGGAEPTKRNQ